MDSKLRELAPEGIRQKIQILKEDLFELRRKKRFRQLEDTTMSRKQKSEMARLLTLIREDELNIRSLGSKKLVIEKDRTPARKKESEARSQLKAPLAEAARKKGPVPGRQTKSAVPKLGPKRKGIFERLGLRKKAPGS